MQSNSLWMQELCMYKKMMHCVLQTQCIRRDRC